MNRELPPQPEKRIRTKLIRCFAVGLVGAILATTLTVSASNADELDDRRKELDKQLVRQDEIIGDASAEVVAAVRALKDAQQKLSASQTSLTKAEQATSQARQVDRQRAAELSAAEQKVTQAQDAVKAAQTAYDKVDVRTNQEITVMTQQSGTLVQLSLLLGDFSFTNLNQRAQLASTLLESSARDLDELTSARLRLEGAKDAAIKAQAEAKQVRESAAQALRDTQAKEKVAVSLRDQVAQQVRSRDAAKQAADTQLSQEKKKQAALEAESAGVDKRIKQRIEEAERRAREEAARKAREEAARKAAEEAARKAAEEAARKAAAKRKADTEAEREADAEAERKADAEAERKAAAARSKPKPAPGETDSGSASSSSGRLMFPLANPRMTSRYGWRLHPILGTWKLHDGTDFGAACGTPMRAPADGVVSEKYYNAGYGNRLMIDHGKINGTYLTTGFNHAQRYVVSVGQRVSKGQLIGYVGTTGYSTGCHLHLMAWENGNKVNPMAKWFSY